MLTLPYIDEFSCCRRLLFLMNIKMLNFISQTPVNCFPSVLIVFNFVSFLDFIYRTFLISIGKRSPRGGIVFLTTLREWGSLRYLIWVKCFPYSFLNISTVASFYFIRTFIWVFYTIFQLSHLPLGVMRLHLKDYMMRTVNCAVSITLWHQALSGVDVYVFGTHVNHIDITDSNICFSAVCRPSFRV